MRVLLILMTWCTPAVFERPHGLKAVALRAKTGAPADESPPPIGEAEGLLAYRFEKADLNFADVLALRDGRRRLGKVLEWGGQIIFYGAGGERAAYPLSDVETFSVRRWERHFKPPQTPDLTVAYVERLPRDPHWHGRVVAADGVPRLDLDPAGIDWRPKPGAAVKFRVHVRNAGGERSPATTVRLSMDGEELATVPLDPIAPGATQVVELNWSWQEGPHTLRVEIDPEKKTTEFLRWNNTLDEPVHGLGVVVAVARQRYEEFSRTPNLVESFCFEDWMQYHLRCLNALFAASVYPSAPQGVQERVRLDRVIVVEDPGDESGWTEALEGMRRGGKSDGLAEYASLILLAAPGSNEQVASTALSVNWTLLKAIGRDLGLIDLALTDTRLEQCMVRDRADLYVQTQHLFPWPQTLMHTPGGFPIDEPGAAYLNAWQGRPRGVGGTYTWQVPEQVVVEVVDNQGGPVSDAVLDVYQLAADGPTPGMICGADRYQPLVSATTDSKGRVALPNRPAPETPAPSGYAQRPNAFGTLAVDGSNGLLMFRVRRGTDEEFHFLRRFDCNVAFLRGRQEEFVHRIRTRFAPPGAPPPMPYTAVRIHADDESPRRALSLGWRPPAGDAAQRVEELRVYKRTGFADAENRPWTPVSILPRDASRKFLPEELAVDYFDDAVTDSRFSLDTFFAVTVVDKLGRESALTPGLAFLAHGKDCVKFAVSPDPAFQAFVTLTGPGPGQMLHFNHGVGIQPFGLRLLGYEGYRPEFGGLAVTPDLRLVITDPANHLLAFYERGDLQSVVPRPPRWPGLPGNGEGRFNTPTDVAVDDDGRLYVADQGNDRIQILDSNGSFRGLLDGDFGFIEPLAVGYGNGRICVTDDAGRRCRVYDVTDPGGPKLAGQLPPLKDADRAIASRTGKIYVTARNPEGDEWAVLRFDPAEEGFALTETLRKVFMQGGEVDRPRGLCRHATGGKEYGYFVNRFPFTVRRVTLE